MSRQLFICVARGKRGATRRLRGRRMADRQGSICRSDLARSLFPLFFSLTENLLQSGVKRREERRREEKRWTVATEWSSTAD